MRSTLLFFILFLFLSSLHVEAKKLDIFLSYCTFYSPNDGPYIETYLSYNGKNLNYRLNNNNMFQSKLDILILFKQNDSIKAFNKYSLFSSEIKDTNDVNYIFHDQQRISIPNGSYDMEISIKDAYCDSPELNISEKIEIFYDDNKIQFSGIELLQSVNKSTKTSNITKGGYDLLPLPLNFYPTSVSKIMFYTELYNTKKVLGDSGMYLYRSYIEEMQTSKKITNQIFQKRMNAKDVEVFIQEFDISKLPSGDYYLVVEAKDTKNNIISVNKLYFGRENEVTIENEMVDSAYVAKTFAAYITNIDTLKEYVKCLRPIATEAEKNFIDRCKKMDDIKLLQQFFFSFWHNRNQLEPEADWIRYYEQVIKVNANFSTKISKGYNTDRGRVYLMYGEPNTITRNTHEPASYPYEIWHYYTIKNQSNRRFIFCNTDLVSNNYELIHSDASGEIYDINWKMKLVKRNFTTRSLDEQDPDFGWGSRVKEFYDAPH
ncbi:MAG: GWxTD domain-containing protein [Bacteroidales bacterium]|nr:GWxTD domain-containing protein [Bacteroidales bacterium]